MPSIEETINDPDFRELSGDDQVAILEHLSGQQSPSTSPQLSQGQDSGQSFQHAEALQPPAQPRVDGGAMPFANRAIAKTVGAPVDLIRAGVNKMPGMEGSIPEDAFGGRKSIERGMGSIGIGLPGEGQQPSTIPEHIGQVVGEASTYMLPLTKTVSALSKGAGTTGRVASTVWKSMIKHPYLTATSELTGSVSAGAGRGVAAEQFPDSPFLQSATEMTAGLAGAMAPTALVNKPTMMAIRAGKNIVKKLIVPFTEKGGKYRAGEFLKEQVRFPTKASIETGAETIADLPPTIASGEKKLIELYKGLTGQDPVADGEMIEKITTSMIKLEGEMRKMGYGSPELLAEITETRIAALELGMDKRVIDATARAQKKLDFLPISKRKAAEGRIVGDELRTEMHKQRVEDQKLWNRVDKDMPVESGNTRETYEELKDGLGQAQQVDIPSTLKGSKVIRGTKVAGQEERDFGTTIREMQSLRSKLLETARQARKDGNWNKARIAGDVADSILVDIEASAGTEAADLRAAIAATKQFKMRFESGEVGRILGFSKSGAPAINPDLTLEMTVGRMGERGAIDISKIVATPAAKMATKSYLGRSFTDYAAPTGTVNPVKAQRWIKTNEAILDEYPDLKKMLTDSAESQDFADGTRTLMEARKAKLRDPKISTSARFLNRESIGKAIEDILDVPRSSGMAAELVKQASKDTSGDALAGLRAGFVEHILDKNTTGPFNDLGEQTLSGRGILNFINKNESTLRTVFDNTQITRMRRVGKELSKIETFEKVTPTTSVEMNDWASTTLRMVGRLGGARLGGQIGSGSMGGSLQYASIFSSRGQRFMNWLSHDKAKQFVQDAILSDDPKMLQSLLDPMTKPKASRGDVILLNKQLNAWLGSTGERVLYNTEE